MRELLYKAKAINRDPNRNYRTDYKNGDWVFGLVSKLDKYAAEMTNEGGVSGIDIDRDTICEYIGLSDKNKTKVFESDIVKVIYDNIVAFGVFKYHEDNACWLIHIKVLNRHLQPFNHPEMEVVGNIYDNPELLEAR